MPKGEVFTAKIARTGDRYRDWIAVFGSDRVPIQSPFAITATLPNIGERQVYLLALNQLSAGQRERLILYLSRRFGQPLASVERDIDTEGVPLLAEDLLIDVDARVFL